MDYRVFVVNRSEKERGNIVGRWVDLPVSDNIFEVVLEDIGTDWFGYELVSCDYLFPFSFPDIDVITLNDLVELHKENPSVFMVEPTISNFTLDDGSVVSVVWIETDTPEDDDGSEEHY